MRRLRRRLQAGDGEAGLTLIELLVASAMSVIIVGAASAMMISAVRDQPSLSKRAQNVSAARWVLERMTREIRNGLRVDEATSSKVSFLTKVRRSSCGGGVEEEEGKPAISCQVTYTCTTTSCSRIEAAPEVTTGTSTTLVSGIVSSKVFNFSPDAEEATFIGVTLRVPNPDGTGTFTISDGAGLRTTGLLE